MSQLFAWGGQSNAVLCFSIIPSKEHPGLISFRMGWLDPLAVQGTLKTLLQLHSSKASVLWHSTFFTVQLSHPYMTTGKTTALIRQTFVGKVTSLIFNMLSKLVITFLPRSKLGYHQKRELFQLICETHGWENLHWNIVMSNIFPVHIVLERLTCNRHGFLHST